MHVDRVDAAERHIYEGWYQREERQLLARLIRPGGTVIDVGANIGVMTIVAAASVGPAGKVYAFEPNPPIADRLRRHVADLPQVEVQQVAVGANAGEAELHIPDRAAGTASLWPEYAGGPRSVVRVDVAKLDELLPGVREVDVLKVDVEGYEGEVLSGASRLIDSGAVRHFLLEWSNWGPPERRDWLRVLLDRLGDAFVCRRVTAERRLVGVVLAPTLVPFDWAESASIASCNVLVSRAGDLP